ncbi:hypothetical protein GUJ93_ZPchr0010g9046 [Zizania palustris]|uniref:Protein MIZU-KUSSEI 1 n=1 Tax=Zizania palustris TaxID=103762 RepID=A0A8J5WEP8_ZIZPA|nr:hypothetical protein GUJ93_ZPchr0010g9046 [Zizania palustris]
MGFGSQPVGGDHHTRRGSLQQVSSSGGTEGTAAASLTTPAASTSGSTRTSTISSLGGGASDEGGGGPALPPAARCSTLEAPSRRNRPGRYPSRPARLFQKLRYALPVLTPRCGRLQVGSACEIAAAAASDGGADSHLMSHVVSFAGGARPFRRVTGTLFGRRKGRVVLALQETPRCLPSLVVELALQTHALLRELGNPAGARIVLETERRAHTAAGEEAAKQRRCRSPPLLEEAAWTMFCNGKKTGFAVRREPTDDDLAVMETLCPVSMGAGVLPGRSPPDAAAVQGTDDEVPYTRGCFDHFVGSRDSESLYMIASQGGGTGPELVFFFVRL